VILIAFGGGGIDDLAEHVHGRGWTHAAEQAERAGWPD
jgi:hypothetical protein